ncbi:MAG: hypothetical protein K2X38_01600 [Gemmataceae bacterium]|nr:hypothetical protein [Gemmataceae bacterium]
MASLGNHSAVLSADASRLYSVLGQAGRRLKKWGGEVSSGVGTMLKGLAKSAATGGFAGVAAAGTAALLSQITAPFDRLNDIAKQGNIATQLGLTPEAFTSIAGAAKSAGSDTRDFLEGLITLSGRAAEAAEGKGDVAVEMFQKLKLNANEFQKLNPEQQFYKIFEALNAVQNPAERVNLLLKAFGEDTGKNLVQLLGKSTDELKELGAQFSISAEDMAKAQLANESLQKAQAALGRAFDQILIAMTPVFQFLADKIPVAVKELGPTFQAFGSAVVPVMRGIAIGAAYVWDTFKAGQGIVGVVIGAITKALGYVVDAFASVIGLAKELPDSLRPDWLDDFIKGTEETAETLKAVGRETMQWGKDRVNTFGQSADAARKFFDEMDKGRNDEIAKRKKLLENPGGIAPASKPADYKPLDAALKGSREAAQIEARFYADGLRADDINKQQLKQQQAANKLLQDIKDGVVRITPLGIF